MAMICKCELIIYIYLHFSRLTYSLFIRYFTTISLSSLDLKMNGSHFTIACHISLINVL